MNIDSLVKDLRRLVVATREHHAKTGTSGMAEAIATMFHLLDQNLSQGNPLPADSQARRRATAEPMKCRGCRFWNRNGDAWSYSGDESQDYENIPTKKQKCLRVLHANGMDNQEKSASEPAIVADGSGYAASFWTEPDFGCSSFEELP